MDIRQIKNLIDPHKDPDRQFFLALLDDDVQRNCEEAHIQACMLMLKALYLVKIKKSIESARAEKRAIAARGEYSADDYRRALELNEEIAKLKSKRNSYRPFFSEPYFARMDLTDPREGYNSYYIGKHGDAGLEIVDWRAPLAQKYYQKSRTSFSINEYEYKLVLRRALRTRNGKLEDFKNEYLNLNDYLSREEIAGRDETLIFDPYLREILKSRKEKREITDIIETIQEQQYNVITLPENDEFVLQGVAGSGKTMVMLHRLSYIMYNNDGIRNSDVLIITPSDSFNAFIDELSAVLELEKVKTCTLEKYFLALLKSVGVDLSAKIDFNAPVPYDYLAYIYSETFSADVDKKLSKIYDGIYGMFASADVDDVISAVLQSCGNQNVAYSKIKNSSVRVRRCVLGEIKEKPDGGLYYTKQFRTMFNCVSDVSEFLNLVKSDERMKQYAFFYGQLLSFYKSVKFLRRNADKICATALADLNALSVTVDKEIADLRRYKMKLGANEVLTYSAGIEKRLKLLEEIQTVKALVEEIRGLLPKINEFADVLRGDGAFVAIGRCENTQDVLRYFNREILKKAKAKFSVNSKPLVRCDPFALCLILCKLGYNVTPKYSYIFVDEAQDISPEEYSVIRSVNDRAIFNIFGDLKQNITSYRGVKSWEELGFKIYSLNLNYRNTNQIVEYVSGNLGIEMKSIGLNGCEVEEIDKRSVTGYLSDKNGLKAIICSENNFEKFVRKTYNLPAVTGKISKTKINLMTVYQSKGLEFTAVAVVDGDLTVNEKYIAYTRALKQLAIVR